MPLVLRLALLGLGPQPMPRSFEEELHVRRGAEGAAPHTYKKNPFYRYRNAVTGHQKARTRV